MDPRGLYGSGTAVPPPALANEQRILGHTAIQAQGALQNTAQVLTPPTVQPPPAYTPARTVPGYNTYDDLRSEFGGFLMYYPGLISLKFVGRSYEGRHLWAACITEDADVKHPERPAVLFTGGQHANEHLSVEMCLHITRKLLAGYKTDAELKDLMDRLVVFIVPIVNPDGSEYDFKLSGTWSGKPGTWRKNRQPNEGSSDIGTDLNRNWGYKWQEGLVAGKPHLDDYEGPAPFSAPETSALRKFIDQYTMAGSEWIRGAIDFHTFGELVLYPFGYTVDPVVEGSMTQHQHDEFAALAARMRDAMHVEGKHDYRVLQSGKQERGKRGLIIDWEWATKGILAFTIELPPRSDAPGSPASKFYPDYQSVVPHELDRAFGAVRVLLREIASRWPSNQ